MATGQKQGSNSTDTGEMSTHRQFRILSILVMGFFLASCVEVAIEPEAEKIYWPMPPELPRYIHEISIVAASDIKKVDQDSASRLMRVVTNSQTVRIPVLKKPMRVASARGKIYVTDTRASLVHVFDIPRGRHFALGYRLEGKLSKPIGITLDQAGNVYVADQGKGRVVVYDDFGLFKRFIGDHTTFDRLTSVAVSPSGDKIYLVDTGGVASQKHEVIIFNKNGQQTGKFGGRGNADGKLNLPTDILVAPDGNVAVLDAGNFRIQWFDANGAFIRSWGEVGKGLGQFGRPRSFALDDDGLLYVTDSFFSNIQVFDNAGNLLLPIGDHGTKPGAGNYALISGISTDETSRVYVLDQFFKKLEVFRKLSPEEGRAILKQN